MVHAARNTTIRRPGWGMARLLLAGLVSGAGLLFVAGTAQAADTPAAHACKADLDKHCSDTQPGDGRILACLRQHAESLSPGCQEQLKQLQHCAGQVKEVCGNVRGRELRACLKDKAEQIDPSCRRGRG